jgi:hypothetical protein
MVRACLGVEESYPIPPPLAERIVRVATACKGNRKQLSSSVIAYIVSEWVHEESDAWLEEQRAIEAEKQRLAEEARDREEAEFRRAQADLAAKRAEAEAAANAPTDWGSVVPGTEVTFKLNGKRMAGEFVKKPGGAQEGKLWIQGEDQEDGKYRAIPEADVKLLEFQLS